MMDTRKKGEASHLLVKLVHVVASLILCLDEGWVLLDLLRGGHLVLRNRGSSHGDCGRRGGDSEI